MTVDMNEAEGKPLIMTAVDFSRKSVSEAPLLTVLFVKYLLPIPTYCHSFYCTYEICSFG